MGSCFLRGGVHALKRRFHAFEKGVHVDENSNAFILMEGSYFRGEVSCFLEGGSHFLKRGFTFMKIILSSYY